MKKMIKEKKELLEELKQIIGRTSYKYAKAACLSKSDLEQELWYFYYKSDKLKNKNIRYINRSLINYTIDIIRKNNKLKKENITFDEDIDININKNSNNTIDSYVESKIIINNIITLMPEGSNEQTYVLGMLYQLGLDEFIPNEYRNDEFCKKITDSSRRKSSTLSEFILNVNASQHKYIELRKSVQKKLRKEGLYDY